MVVTDPDGYVLVFAEPLDTTKTMDQVLGDIAQGGRSSAGSEPDPASQRRNP